MLPEIVESCIKEIAKRQESYRNITYKTGGDGVMLKLKVKNCIHHAKEVLVKEEGVAPYICPIANMVLDQIHEKLKYDDELSGQAGYRSKRTSSA